MENLKDIYSETPLPKQETVLAALFQEISHSKTQSKCSARIISFATALYERLCAREMNKNPFIRVSQANRIAIMQLGLCDLGFGKRTKKAYFDEVTEFDEEWLIGTRLLAEEHGVTVRLKADPRKRRKYVV
jgi:hypothetical protein